MGLLCEVSIGLNWRIYLSLCFLLPLGYLPFEKLNSHWCSVENLCGTGPSGYRVVSTKTGWVLPVIPSESWHFCWLDVVCGVLRVAAASVLTVPNV